MKWTKDKIKEYLKEHPEIKTRQQLRDAYYSIYDNARKIGILDELFGVSQSALVWTPDNIRKYVAEHPEIKSRADLKTLQNGAYHKARKYKMLDELFGKPLCEKIWTPNKLRQFIKEHPEINKRYDLKQYDNNLYHRARKWGMLDELFGESHLIIWTKDMILEFMKEHPEITTRSELTYSYPGVYGAARRFEMLEELFGEPLHHSWTKEECAQLAQLCFYRSQFQDLYPGAYSSALLNGWLDEICSHMKELVNFVRPGRYTIYVYEDEVNHYAYVGLTNNAYRRDIEHVMSHRDRVYKHCKKFDIPVPKMKILKTDLSASQASEEEKRAYETYKVAGWNMINTEKPLGRLGGQIRFRIDATKEINSILEEHPEITSAEELKTFSKEAYKAAKYLNILEDIFQNKDE